MTPLRSYGWLEPKPHPPHPPPHQSSYLWGPILCVFNFPIKSRLSFDLMNVLPAFFFFFFFVFLGPQPWHMEFLRLGVESRAASAGLCDSHSHSHLESKLHLRPTPQLTATLDL